MNIENRIRKIEKALTLHGKGQCYLRIYDDLSKAQRNELAKWTLGITDKQPDFWLSEERTSELRQQGYSVKTRDELRAEFEICIKTHKRRAAMEIKKDGLDRRSILGPNYLN